MKILLNSEEINLLIYRYLIENGFTHSAFSFCHEGQFSTNGAWTTYGEHLPPNALISFLQKALLYIWIEFHTGDDTGDEIPCNQPFSFFRRHECWYNADAETYTSSIARPSPYPSSDHPPGPITRGSQYHPRKRRANTLDPNEPSTPNSYIQPDDKRKCNPSAKSKSGRLHHHSSLDPTDSGTAMGSVRLTRRSATATANNDENVGSSSREFDSQDEAQHPNVPKTRAAITPPITRNRRPRRSWTAKTRAAPKRRLRIQSQRRPSLDRDIYMDSGMMDEGGDTADVDSMSQMVCMDVESVVRSNGGMYDEMGHSVGNVDPGVDEVTDSSKSMDKDGVGVCGESVDNLMSYAEDSAHMFRDSGMVMPASSSVMSSVEESSTGSEYKENVNGPISCDVDETKFKDYRVHSSDKFMSDSNYMHHHHPYPSIPRTSFSLSSRNHHRVHHNRSSQLRHRYGDRYRYNRQGKYENSHMTKSSSSSRDVEGGTDVVVNKKYPVPPPINKTYPVPPPRISEDNYGDDVYDDCAGDRVERESDRSIDVVKYEMTIQESEVEARDDNGQLDDATDNLPSTTSLVTDNTSANTNLNL